MRFLVSVVVSLSLSSLVLNLNACGGSGATIATYQGQRNQTFAQFHLFVANFGDAEPYVSMYGLRSNKLQQRINAPFYTQESIADDAMGRLYVSDRNLSWVRVYGPKKKYIDYTITQGVVGPAAISLGTDGSLYVMNYSGPPNGSIAVFGPGEETPERQIIDGIHNPAAISVDSSGTLFVANTYVSGGDYVTVYPPGGSTRIATITKGIRSPIALATDAGGRLYVVNTTSSASTVTVYAPSTFKYIRTISEGLKLALSLALDGSGNLYVGNASNITVYSRGKSKVIRTLYVQGNGGLTEALAFDGNGELYAAYEGNDFGGVRIYDPGSDTPSLTIKRKEGVWQPFALAIGP